MVEQYNVHGVLLCLRFGGGLRPYVLFESNRVHRHLVIIDVGVGNNLLMLEVTHGLYKGDKFFINYTPVCNTADIGRMLR